MDRMETIIARSTGQLTVEEIGTLGTWMLEGEVEAAIYQRAVRLAFGDLIAEWALMDWLRGVEAMEWPPSRGRESWRAVTDQSLRRMASQIARQVPESKQEERYDRPNR